MTRMLDHPAAQRSIRPDAGTVISLQGVSKGFGSHRTGRAHALRDVSLTVPAGRFVTVVGPTGCGKTTLLRLMGGLVDPDEGSVRVFGAPPRPGRGIGFVFQSFRLLPWATVAANVSFPLEMQRVPKPERRRRVAHYLDLVGLARVAHAYPSQLSGGMRQRAALARALVTEPDILLMDEPFASVDAQTRELLQNELMRLWSVRRPAVVFVTHSIEEAILLGDAVLVMGGHPGDVIERFDVDLTRPRDALRTCTQMEFLNLRKKIGNIIRSLVVGDPGSEFFGRR